MNLVITEPWLDLIAASIACFGMFVAVFIGVKEWMDMQRVQTPQFTPAFAEAGAMWEKPRYQPMNMRMHRSRPASSSSLFAPQPDKGIEPELVFRRAMRTSGTTAHLSICNEGAPLMVEELIMGKFNEVDIKQEGSEANNRVKVDSFGLMQFGLRGRDIENRTYQFTICFRDPAGRLFRQEIAGLGTEPPIIDEVVPA